MSEFQFPPEVTTLGEAIRYLREQRKVTLRWLGREVGVSAPFLSDLEHNRRSTDKLPEMEKALDVPPGTLQRFDGRLEKDLAEWLKDNPKLVDLLRSIRDRHPRIIDFGPVWTPVRRFYK
jgi:transcriptional regulator with XRE-family HTH domain